MTIRDFKKTDRDAVIGMADTFYNSPGVLHRIPVENFAEAFDEMCAGGSQRLRGLLIEVDGAPAGYCQLSFSYSTEAGGSVVLIEEVYVLESHRGLGIGSKLFEYISNEYRGKAARIRLEVAPANTRAIELYERLGFERLHYVQMILEDY